LGCDVVDGGSYAFATTSFARVDDARPVRFVAFLHGRVPVILNGIIRPSR